MPTTLTLKNIPDELYGRLKEVSDTHRRSLNSEVIACLEQLLLPRRVSVTDRLNKAKQLRASLPAKAFSATDIADAIQQGRS